MSSLLLRTLPRVLGFSLSCALAALPACSDDPDGQEDSETPEEEEPDAPTGNRDAGGRPILDASKPAPRADAGSKPDTGNKPPVTGNGLDAGKPDAATPAVTPDAGKPPTTAPAGCADMAAPHSCFTPAASNPKGCPAKSPEIPLGLPPLNEWELCNGGMVSAGASCVYNGPNGASANCLCDTGVHWLCVYL